MLDDAVKRQLQELSARLDRVEKQLGLQDLALKEVTAAEQCQPAPQPQGKAQALRRLAKPSTATERIAPDSPQRDTTERPTSRAKKVPVEPSPATKPLGAAVPVEKPEQHRPASGFSWEMFLGGKTTAWLGAIIVVLGTGFAVKEFGAGFWSNLSSSMQAMLVATFGGVLLAGGEMALRRLGRAASVGLFSAGLGILYLDAYALYQWFNPPVVTQEIAFVLMSLVAAAAFAVTVRTRSLTIGVLSLIGGYLTPLLLSGSGAQPLPIMVYLTLLAAVALALAARLPKSFHPLRYVALAGQMILGLAVIIAYGQTHWVMMLVFPAIWWTMFMSEAVLTAMRDRGAIGNITSSFLATVAFVTVGGWILTIFTPAGSQWLGMFTLMVATLSAAAALHFGPGLDTLRGTLRTAMDKLAIALWVQCGILGTLAVALQFDGYGATVGWLSLALGSIEIGRRVPSRGVSIFGLIIGALATLRLVTLDLHSGALDAVVWSWSSLTISGWAILSLAAVLAMHAAAARIGPLSNEPKRAAPIVLASLGTASWMIWWSLHADGLLITAGWLFGAAALLTLESFGRRQRYLELAMIVLLAAAVRWLLLDALAARVLEDWSAFGALPLINAQMAMAVALIIGGAWAVRRLRLQHLRLFADESTSDVSPQRAGALPIAMLGGTLFLLLALSFEVDRTVTRIAETAAAISWSPGHMRNLMLTMLWALGSVGMGVLAQQVGRQPNTRTFVGHGSHLLLQSAWGLLVACALKWILIDTAFWTLQRTPGSSGGLSAVFNVQLLVGMVVAAAAVALMNVSKAYRDTESGPDARPWQDTVSWLPVGVSFLLLWGLSFEVDRVLGQMDAAERLADLWPMAQLRGLLWTGLWAIGGLGVMLFGRWRKLQPPIAIGWGLLVLTGIAWLLVDTLGWRISHGLVQSAVVFNMQFVIGLAVAAMLGVGAWANTRGAHRWLEPPFIAVGLGVIAAMGLWLGSLEIDRYFAGNSMGRQMGLSVYWTLFGVLLVMLGFLRHVNALRYVGLGLLAVAVMKVVVIDLATVDQVWRVVSFIVSGLLLIGTSIAYRRFASSLLVNLPR